MITCQKCQHINPMGTIFCHACGDRINVQAAEVHASVHLTRQGDLDRNIYYWGRNAVSLCSFLLVVAIIINFVMVPAVPPADLPQMPPFDLFKGATPPQLQTMQPAPVAAEPGSTGDLSKQNRLTWRQQQGTFILSSLGLDLGGIRQWQTGIIAQQALNGSFAGSDTAAATALATLALQAYPASDAASVAAARARAFLLPLAKSAISMDPVARSLVILALLDADEFDKKARDNMGLILVDGSAPEWQALSLLAMPAGERPAQVIGLRGKLNTPTWNGLFAALGHEPPAIIEPKSFAEDAGKALTTGEARFFWTVASWNYPLAPKDLAALLKTWSGAAPVAASPALEKMCGRTASAALAVLTVTAPIRAPALSLNPNR